MARSVWKESGLLAVAVCAATAAGAVGIEFLPNGGVQAGEGVRFSAVHFSDKWVNTDQIERKSFLAEAVRDGATTRFSAPWKLNNNSAEVNMSVTATEQGGNAWKFDYRIDAAKPVPTASLSVQLSLATTSFAGKTLWLNDKPYVFPGDTFKGTWLKLNDIRKVEFPVAEGMLSIDLAQPVYVSVTDYRQFNANAYGLRLTFPGTDGNFQGTASLSFTLRIDPWRGEAIDLRRAVNMGFADDVAGDGKGGWCDEGSNNDLSDIKPGRIQAAGIGFDVIDPAGNGGKSCIVLGGGKRPHFPAKVEIPAAGKQFRTLLLMHALASPPAGVEIGAVKAIYADGSVGRFPVISNREVANWWQPVARENGVVAWRGKSGRCSDIGLYVSAFPLENKPLKSLELEANGAAPAWMVVAVSGAAQRIVLPKPVGYTLRAGDEWRPMKTTREIEAGSALDFSFIQDAPAGKYGFVKIKDGKFVFENQQKPVRFYGANLCFLANYLDKEQADKLAERLSRIGYNAIRFHHYDRDVVQNLPANSTTFNKQNLDKLDYLVYALKKRGIYLTTDLFTERSRKPGEFKSFPTLELQRDYKLAAMLLPEVRDNLKAFARELLTHKNPYTGLSWADDPAFIGFSLINENTIFHIINISSSDEIRRIYNEHFEKWAAEKKITVTDQNRLEQFRAFLSEVYCDYYDDMVKFMREIGVKVPLTDQNFIMSPNLTAHRAAYDYVDNHLYWDHPVFIGVKQWAPPSQFLNKSVLFARLQSPCELAPTRVFGKPFTVTEFDFCHPNGFRAEGAPIFSAYAAMQDWDGIFRFAYSHSNGNLFQDATIGTFDVVNDPIRILSERIGIAFFTRGDVQVAKAAFPVAVSPVAHVNYTPNFPKGAAELTLFGRVGSLLYEGDGKFSPALPDDTRAIYAYDSSLNSKNVRIPLLTGRKPADVIAELLKLRILNAAQIQRKGAAVTSLTGELSADFDKAVFQAVTPRSEAFVLPEKQRAAGRFATAESTSGFSVFSAIAIDGKTLAESSRMLLLHLSNTDTEGTRYASPEMTVLLSYGKGATVVRKAVSQVSLKVSGDGWKLYALNLEGRRVGEVPFRKNADGISFTADTFGPNGDALLAYELVRE